LNPRARDRFDRLLEEVLAELPPWIHELLERVPLHVEDYPAPDVIAHLGLEYRDDLCGLYTGIPLGEKSVDHAATMPDFVSIYREGIVAIARDQDGTIRRGRLREEIRKTLLHELAHHHGFTEDDLEELGYQ
jgi:predicted Zn-dependent protease with MMP-like domain